jgi:hypothetical protein
MSAVMILEWPGFTREQYDRVMSNLDFDTKPPTGGILHVAGFANGNLRVIDVWDSQQAFERFQQERLKPAVQQAGISGQPKVELFPLHNVYAPNIEKLRQIATSALPHSV